MDGATELSFSTRVAASPALVWDHAVSIRGVNRELFPLARMTHPSGLDRLDPARVVPGERLFRSWILALGFLPVDYDDLTLVEIEPGRRFLERSVLLSQREWVHERVIEADGSGSVVTDRVRFVPRIGWLAPLHRVVFGLAFRLRHRNLARILGPRGGAEARG